MPEAEDVLLETAERAFHAWRALRGHAPEAPADAVRLSDESRRLADWLAACFGRSWAIEPTDPPLRPSWWARRFGSVPPWALHPVAVPWHDGDRLRLPRRLGPELGDPPARRTLLLLAALALGRRLARGCEAELPADPVARDCFLALEGAQGDAWLAAAFPGLGSALDEARRRARASRPAGQCLRGRAEPFVEALVRRLLDGPAATVARALPAPLSLESAPGEIAALAQQLAGALEPAGARDYRGVAPVFHWGVIARGGPGREGPGEAGAALPSRCATRELARAPRVRGADEGDPQAERQGPFVLPFGDPALALQDPAGLSRPPDTGDEDIDGLRDALEELSEARIVRSREPVREILSAELAPSRAPAATSSPPADPGLLVFRYPEWDPRLAAYRPDFCRVLEAPAPLRGETLQGASPPSQQGLRRKLRRRMEALRPRRARRPRQRDGNDLDVDGFVGELADRRAGRAANGRVYLEERPRRRDVAVTLLLDASGSTDAGVGNSRSVIDVEKEAALAFCEVSASLGDRCSVLAFSGRGPEQVRIRRVKGFDDTVGEELRSRIAALEPDGFTRLGAALRHGAADLARERARLRLLLLLSDGKPYDEDDYGGPRGIADVRQAVAEAERAGLAVFCMTVDRDAPRYLPRLFGPGRYAALSRVEQLPERLTEAYRRLTRNA
jgi:nitric oxide reductase NorD protein